ncbi:MULTISPECIES: MipA/OmpV family protein [unclassified Gilliamella]|uniref:MipA/OmpV family protein n=1 Tax=unclassified Gilliamella TaxID=2685620 RepID=UPI00226A0B9A|nr:MULTISPECIES: MipA/OmpV family protein [unclassified Gilliamella]MCX8584332.1 MipA/OmpV family protein [Gilliamella sp. B3372]MCX8595167.1 MipA/OmpV family protein [Gilliamella sp. B3367]
MKKLSCIISLLSMFPLGYTHIASADPTSLGVGLGWSNSPYKNYSSSYYPVPHIDYDNGYFFIDDLSAGIYAFNNDNQSLSFGVRYLANEFKPHDSDNHKLRQLNSRHSTVLAEIDYDITTNWGIFSSSIGADMLNNSNGILVNADYTVPYIQGNLIIAPTIGINWADGKHNDYYYGVSHKESSRSGLRYFNADSSFTPYFEIGAQYSLTDNIATFGGIHIDKLTGDAADSPIVDDSTITSIYMGLSYKF